MQPKLAALFAFGLGTYAPIAWGSNIFMPPRQTVAVKESPQHALIAIQGLSVASYATSPDGFEISLKFNEPVQESVARDISKLVAPIADSSTGYDSMLMRFRMASIVELQESPGGFALEVRPLLDQADDVQSTNLEIRRYTLLKDTEHARDLLAPLRKAQPQDSSLLRLDADIDLMDRNYRAAESKLEYLLKLSPDEQGAKQSLYAARLERAPHIEGGIETREIEGADRQRRAVATAEVPLEAGLSLRGRIDYVSLEDNAVQLPTGTISAVKQDLFIGEIGLRIDFATRWFANINVHLSEEELGTSASIEYRDASSDVKLSTGFSQPTWDYPETIAADGTIDYLGFSVQKEYDENWFLNLALALRRYSIGGEEDAATVSSIEAGLRWEIPWEYKTQVSFGYTLDAEYAHNIALRPDGGGGFYALLPVGDRVQHVGDVRLADNLTDELFASFLAGYIRDNEGSDGLVAGAELTYTPIANLRIALNAYYSGISDRLGESGSYLHAGISVTRILAPALGTDDEE